MVVLVLLLLVDWLIDFLNLEFKGKRIFNCGNLDVIELRRRWVEVDLKFFSVDLKCVGVRFLV